MTCASVERVAAIAPRKRTEYRFREAADVAATDGFFVMQGLEQCPDSVDHRSPAE